MKILITGANGQLGQEFRALADQYQSVQFYFFSKDDLDIADEEAVALSIDSIKPDMCINCAAYTAVDKAEEDSEAAFRINAEGAKNLALICKQKNVRLIHISTDYVFDGNGQKPYVESDVTAPVGVYGASKLAGEKWVQQYAPEAVIIRTSWVFSVYGNNFVKTMLRLMSVKESLNVVSDQKGCPTYAADLAQAVMAIVKSGQWLPGLFHYCNSEETNWFEFAKKIKEHCGFHCSVNPITTAQYPTPAKRPAYSVLDTQKITTAYSLQVRSWKEALCECLEKLHCGR